MQFRLQRKSVRGGLEGGFSQPLHTAGRRASCKASLDMFGDHGKVVTVAKLTCASARISAVLSVEERLAFSVCISYLHTGR